MSRVTKKVLKQMFADGVRSDTHHATLKKSFREVTGADDNPDKDEQDAIRAGLDVLESAPEEQPLSEKERTARAQAYVTEMQEDPDVPAYWNKVVGVAETNDEGKPTRVVIACQDPQENGDGESVCVKQRTIFTQDLFQVSRCETCQDRYMQLYRNKRARIRRKQQKEAEKA